MSSGEDREKLNRVEELNRFVLLKKLKVNQLLPISVIQINAKGYKNLKKRKKKSC
jgi:hypothetical protein